MRSFLISDVRIFDGQRTIIESGSLLVENGKISRISSEPIEFDGIKLSKPGHTVVPGIVDAHIHADGGSEIALPQSLRCGVTTACDMHNENYNIAKLRKQVAGGDCADIKAASFAATVEGGWPMSVVLAHSKDEKTLREIATWPRLITPDDGRQYVHDRLKDGVDYIKLMHESGTLMDMKLRQPSMELQRAIIHEAHKHGLRVVAHATCYRDTLDILEAGVDGLTHCFTDRPIDDKILAAYRRNGAHLNPTINIMGSGTKEGQKLQEHFARDPRVQRLVGARERENMCRCMGNMCAAGSTQKNAIETVRFLKQQGIDILCGSDAAGPAHGTAWGASIHHELHLFVHHCGFTPTEALRSATYLPAQRFNFNDRGQIKEGLRADLVLVEGDPTTDISDLLNLRGVWVEGKLCSFYKDLIEGTG